MLTALVLPLFEEGPAPEDVKAGWLAFAVFIGLIVAVALLGMSLVKHLRRAQAAKDAGVYGDEPAPADEGTAESTGTTGPDAGLDPGSRQE